MKCTRCLTECGCAERRRDRAISLMQQNICSLTCCIKVYLPGETTCCRVPCLEGVSTLSDIVEYVIKCKPDIQIPRLQDNKICLMSLDGTLYHGNMLVSKCMENQQEICFAEQIDGIIKPSWKKPIIQEESILQLKNSWVDETPIKFNQQTEFEPLPAKLKYNIEFESLAICGSNVMPLSITPRNDIENINNNKNETKSARGSVLHESEEFMSRIEVENPIPEQLIIIDDDKQTAPKNMKKVPTSRPIRRKKSFKKPNSSIVKVFALGKQPNSELLPKIASGLFETSKVQKLDKVVRTPHPPAPRTTHS